jgi:sialate O-acetylesterase
MPFYFVQLASFVAHKPTEVVEFDSSAPAESYWAELREAQLETLTSTDQTGMAVAIDVGAANNIHPGDKKTVGQRLAYWAIAKDYNKQIPHSGPLYKSMTIEKAKKGKLPYSGKNVIRVKFDYADNGLVIKGEKLKGIAIAGIDRKFVWADAMIENNELIVWSDNVKAPVAVRYGWNKYSDCNLYNKSNLPASPFRTDKWFAMPGVNKNN